MQPPAELHLRIPVFPVGRFGHMVALNETERGRLCAGCRKAFFRQAVRWLPMARRSKIVVLPLRRVEIEDRCKPM
jgi:hypothetical protein